MFKNQYKSAIENEYVDNTKRYIKVLIYFSIDFVFQVIHRDIKGRSDK